MIDPRLNCIVPNCRKAAVDRHAVCAFHLFAEISILVGFSSLLFFVMIYTVIR